jgi:hypothetical protein
MTTRSEREQILEQVRPLHRVVHGQPLAGTAAHAAVAITQSRHSPQLLPREAVELRALGTAALLLRASLASAPHTAGYDHAAVRANPSQDHAVELLDGPGSSQGLASDLRRGWHKKIYVRVWTGGRPATPRTTGVLLHLEASTMKDEATSTALGVPRGSPRWRPVERLGGTKAGSVQHCRAWRPSASPPHPRSALYSNANPLRSPRETGLCFPAGEQCAPPILVKSDPAIRGCRRRGSRPPSREDVNEPWQPSAI